MPVGESDLGWPKATLTGAFTASCFASAALAPFWGHQIDSGHARQVLIGGSICAAIGMVALSQVVTVVQFYAVWIWLGAAMAACVYRGMSAHEYAARQIKQAVVGTGGAHKEQVQHMVKTLLQLPSAPKEDAADALAAALCHFHTHQAQQRLPVAVRSRGRSR